MVLVKFKKFREIRIKEMKWSLNLIYLFITTIYKFIVNIISSFLFYFPLLFHLNLFIVYLIYFILFIFIYFNLLTYTNKLLLLPWFIALLLCLIR